MLVQLPVCSVGTVLVLGDKVLIDGLALIDGSETCY